MKLYFTLAIFIWGAEAFVAPSHGRNGFGLQSQSSSFSYLDNIGKDSRKELTGGQVNGPVQKVEGESRMTNSGGPKDSKSTQKSDMTFAKNIWDTLSPVTVQGGSLRTWSVDADRVQVLMRTDGRPLTALIDLWHGPDNTPLKMGVYIEDGDKRPFSAVIETPRGHNAVAIRNKGQLEFPLAACVEADTENGSKKGTSSLAEFTKKPHTRQNSRTIQGGAVHTYPFSSSVSSVQVSLKTEGRPMSARIELLQGPNNIKQVMEIETEDGLEFPFFAVIESPGTGNVVRIVNVATVEYPLTASVEPYIVEQGYDNISEGGGGWDTSTNKFNLLDR